MTSAPAIEVAGVNYRYGERLALDDVAFEIQPGEIFALLGPNGGGKTTLFRLLSTLIPPQQGTIRLLGLDVRRQASAVRQSIGVVFQAPSLDKKLSVRENLHCQGHLYGLTGRLLRSRAEEMLGRLGLEDRAKDRVETLSGGLRRRVELAKGMLHYPRLLLLDEPSTGLDPAARSDLWIYLHELRSQQEVTIVLTTHLLEEAEKADRLAILNAGKLVALDTPGNLRSSIGGDSIAIECDDPAPLAAAILGELGYQVSIVDGSLRLHEADGPRAVARLMDAFGHQIRAVTLGKPSLEDVFIARTGHRFWHERSEAGHG